MSTYYNQFTKDATQLESDAAAYNQAVQTEQAALNAYNNQYNAIVAEMATCKDPSVLLALFMMLGLQQGLSQEDNAVNVSADSLKVQGDVGQCFNDIANMYTPSSDASIQNIADSLDQMLQYTTPATNVNGTNYLYYGYAEQMTQTSADQSIQTALGSSTTTQLYGYLQNLRGQIFVEGAALNTPNTGFRYWQQANYFNPSTGQSPAPYQNGGTNSYYFDTLGDTATTTNGVTTINSANGYIGNIALLQYALTQSGDPYQATEAMQAITNNNNELNASVTSVSNATQVALNARSNTIQTWIAFYENISQELNKTCSASVHNQISV